MRIDLKIKWVYLEDDLYLSNQRFSCTEMGVKLLLRQYDILCTMSFDCIRFMTMNKLLRKWRNIVEKGGIPIKPHVS